MFKIGKEMKNIIVIFFFFFMQYKSGGTDSFI